tara:strand:+ start:12351 stop:13331 length:981 start_codon:yes stop_codon:yes gene_type:complete
MIDRQVTWLIPVKNGMPFIKECLQSIYNQSYSNQKIIAWDNGSTDGSLDELKKWIPKLIKGEIISNKPIDNLGKCRAELVKRANTELIAIMDCDDINHNDRLKIQVELINKSDNIVGVGSYINRVDKNNNFIRIEKLPKTNPDILKWQLLFRCPLYQPTMLLKKSMVLKSGNYNNLRTAQDYDLWLRLIQLGDIKIIDKPLVNYRISGNTVSDHNRFRWNEINRDLYKKYAKYFFDKSNNKNLLELWDNLSPQSSNFKKTKINTRIFLNSLVDFSLKNNINIINLLTDKLVLKQYFRTKEATMIKNILYFIYFLLFRDIRILYKIK